VVAKGGVAVGILEGQGDDDIIDIYTSESSSGRSGDPDVVSLNRP
jgi:hypothetical protein